jgi:hypothetical protein
MSGLDPDNVPPVLRWTEAHTPELLERLLLDVGQEHGRALDVEYRLGLEAGRELVAQVLGATTSDSDKMVVLNDLAGQLRLAQTMAGGRAEYRRGVVYTIKHVRALLHAGQGAANRR